MVLIAVSQVQVSREALRGKERDTLQLTWEERRWTRKRVTTTGGREVALALPTGSVLHPGAIVVVEADWYLAVEGCPEPVLAVVPRDRAEAVRIAFAVGNRHFPLALDGEYLLVPDDSAMEQLLSRLGVRWERWRAVFDPVGAGHRHDHGTSVVDADSYPGLRQRHD
jgi:urease accessory protein